MDMNQEFKVLWNRFRNSYVVASEAHASHGKSGKAAKTVLAAAVAGAIAFGGTAAAQTAPDLTISNDSFGNGDYTTTKFLSGKDSEVINIQTTGSATGLINAVNTALGKLQPEADLSGALGALRPALGRDPVTGDVTLVGFAGGHNYQDVGLSSVLGFVAGGLGTDAFDQLESINKNQEESLTLSLKGGKEITIGGPDSEPLMILTTGADRVINAGATLFGSGVPETSFNVTRVGNIAITAKSGNLFGLTGGSSAINVSGLRITALSGGLSVVDFSAESTSVTIDGNVDVTLAGSTNAAGVLLSGSALALGGTANSTVTGNSTLNISSSHVDGHNVSGVTVGVFGGGLAASTLNGESKTEVQGETEITIDNGVVVGAFGGGAALSTELRGRAWDAITKLEGAIDKLLVDVDISASDSSTDSESAILNNGGTANAVSRGDVVLNAGGDSVTVAMAGGGLAAAWAGSTGTSTSTVETGNITINLGSASEWLVDDPRKGAVQDAANKLINSIRNNGQGLSGMVGAITEAVKVSQGVGEDGTGFAGAHVGTVGGSIVLAGQPSSSATAFAKAQSTNGKITLNLQGGYNVATLGGGMTLATATTYETSTASGTQATSDVAGTEINISGGENVLVMASGAAFATGSTEQRPNDRVSDVLSLSKVGGAKLTVSGGRVDGVFGGGLAIDDTAASNQNAIARTDSVTIDVKGGEVNAANTYFLTNLGAYETTSGTPNLSAQLYESADLLGDKDGQSRAAIVGGGIATGAGALSEVGSVTINLNGGTVNGNVFAGGAATLGGESKIGTARIAVNGAVVKGDIYGGGLSGSLHNDAYSSDYVDPTSRVEDVTISLAGGSVEGNIYAGGYTHADAQKAVNTVAKAAVELNAKGVFKGEVIDGTGATTSSLKVGAAGYDFEDGQTVFGFNTITADSGKVTNLAYDFAGRDTTVTGAGLVEFSSLTNAGGRTLAVGTTDAAGHAAVNPFENVSGVTFKVENGFLALNSDAQSAQDAIAAAPSQAAAAAYVTGTVDLEKNLLTVGNATAAGTTGLAVGGNGLLVADASGNTSVSGTADFDEGSSIHFVNVAQASTSGVTIGVAEQTPATTVDNVLFKAEKNADNSGYTFSKREASELGEVGLGGFDDQQFLLDVSTGTGSASDFVNSFLDQASAGVDNSNRSQQLNAAVNLATAAGVQTAAIDGAMMGIEAANKRASIINEFNDGGVLFAELSGKHFEVGGGSDFGELDADLGGLVVGGEYTTSDWTFGALANLGTGSVDGNGKNSGVENDVDYYGIEAYAAKRFGMFNLVGQVGYLMSDNDVEHHTTARNTANVDADVFTVGVRGEMRFDITDNTRVVPYVGVNYLRVSTDGYTTSQGVSVDDIDQNLWTTPIGVKFAGDLVTQSGWTWTPSADIAYIPAFGDDDVDAASGVDSAVAHTTMDVWSNSVGRLKLGVRAVKDHFGFGLEAGAATGSDDLTEYFGQVRVDYRF